MCSSQKYKQYNHNLRLPLIWMIHSTTTHPRKQVFPKNKRLWTELYGVFYVSNVRSYYMPLLISGIIANSIAVPRSHPPQRKKFVYLWTLYMRLYVLATNLNSHPHVSRLTIHHLSLSGAWGFSRDRPKQIIVSCLNYVKQIRPPLMAKPHSYGNIISPLQRN